MTNEPRIFASPRSVSISGLADDVFPLRTPELESGDGKPVIQPRCWSAARSKVGRALSAEVGTGEPPTDLRKVVLDDVVAVVTWPHVQAVVSSDPWADLGRGAVDPFSACVLRPWVTERHVEQVILCREGQPTGLLGDCADP